MRRKRSELQVFSVSFLDVISCALGGVLLLLLMISSRSQAEADAHKEQSRQLQQTIASSQSNLKKAQQALAAARQEAKAAEEKAAELAKTKAELEAAKKQAKALGQAIEEVEKARKALIGFKGELKNVVFVFDVSASMGLSKRFEEDKQYLISLIENLDCEKFAVISYSDKVYYFKHNFVSHSDAEVKSAIRFVSSLQAGGGTATMDALKAAISVQGVDTIMFFSDGQPSFNTEADILTYVTRACKDRIVINTIAVGKFTDLNNQHKPFIEFLRDIAMATGGFPMLYTP